MKIIGRWLERLGWFQHGPVVGMARLSTQFMLQNQSSGCGARDPKVSVTRHTGVAATDRHGTVTSVPPSSSSSPMQLSPPITYFRPRRSGPEAVIEDRVAAKIPALFKGRRQYCWTAGSIPLGAGMPDLVIVAYKPLALALADADLSDAQILGYLRAVRSARLDTIAERLRVPNRSMGRRLHRLVEARVLRVTADETFALTAVCRNVLPEIITIEVKVDNWQRAAEQARRNRIFSHRSFVALPASVAERVHREPAFTRLGLGVLAAQETGGVSVQRPARQGRPVVWTYYYQLASLLARSHA